MRLVQAMMFVVATVFASSCVERPQSPSFAVLIDLSETWHNNEQRAYNTQLLESVTSALVATADWPKFVKPTYRFHVIGDRSLYRPPLCTATFDPQLIGGHDAAPAPASGVDASESNSNDTSPRLMRAETFHNRDELRAFLTETCPFYALSPPGEGQTQVTAALVTALRSMSPPRGAANERVMPTGPRRIIVLSDLKEEPISTYTLETENFEGVDILLIYRALWSDRSDVALVEAREARWRSELESRGAHVFSIPDTGVTSETLRPFLLEGVAS